MPRTNTDDPGQSELVPDRGRAPRGFHGIAGHGYVVAVKEAHHQSGPFAHNRARISEMRVDEPLDVIFVGRLVQNFNPELICSRDDRR